MNCEEFALLLDKTPDALTAKESEEMKAHIAACPNCAIDAAIRRDLAALDAPEEVPQSLRAGWRRAIRQEDEIMTRKHRGWGWMRIAAVAAAFVFVVGGAMMAMNGDWGANQIAANYQNKASGGVYSDYEESESGGSLPREAAYGAPDAGPLTEENALGMDMAADDDAQARKIIRNVTMTIKTQNYEADYQAIRQLVDDFGGAVESLSLSGDKTTGALRRANLTLRIPSGRLDAFTGGLDGVGVISSYSESSDDVTDTYYDVQTRLTAQQTKMNRLLALMEQAQDVADLIEIESAITDTQYYIDSYQGRLNNMDSRVNDSYVYITLREISPQDASQTKALTLGQRLGNALKHSVERVGAFFQGMVIFLAAALPWLAGLAVITVAVVLICRAVRKNRRGKDNP